MVTCGDKHVLFWQKEGHSLVRKKGVFGHKAAAQMLLCCSRLQGKARSLSRDSSACKLVDKVNTRLPVDGLVLRHPHRNNAGCVDDAFRLTEQNAT